MPWGDVPAFCASLEGEGMVAECLRFIILTVGPRSAPARNARWSDIDLDARGWTVPGADMKGKKGKTADFRVPLSDGAMSILERIKPFERDGLVFPSPRKGCISDAATARLMERRGIEYRPHGFRSSFRDWSEEVGIEFLVAEMCLAHIVGGRVERAYRRDDLLEKRAIVMQRWSDHCNGKRSATVLSLAEHG
jgi:integrase